MVTKINAQSPTATISAPAIICSGSSANFFATTTNSPTQLTWFVTPLNGVALSTNGGTNTSITFSTSGVYVVSLYASNSFSNTSTSVTVNVIPSAKASFNASLTSYGFPNQLILTNYSTNIIKNYWLQNNSPIKDSSLNSIKNYSLSGAYSVSLVALGLSGCNDTASYNFYINDSSGVILPNIFSPNDDGVNDVFKPIANGIKNMSVYVYDRWGILITNWETVNGFWDGYTTSGLPCSNGVYTCILQATGFNGKNYSMQGFITLVR
ncbi:MAG: gliding motility-associated C-terminal domain-containing protein [Bacteroidetes bacterium]|nr:gliding motility-associated C-terminal domain-containing protein [Bacteroidota bacterium]